MWGQCLPPCPLLSLSLVTPSNTRQSEGAVKRGEIHRTVVVGHTLGIESQDSLNSNIHSSKLVLLKHYLHTMVIWTHEEEGRRRGRRKCVLTSIIFSLFLVGFIGGSVSRTCRGREAGIGGQEMDGRRGLVDAGDVVHIGLYNLLHLVPSYPLTFDLLASILSLSLKVKSQMCFMSSQFLTIPFSIG